MPIAEVPDGRPGQCKQAEADQQDRAREPAENPRDQRRLGRRRNDTSSRHGWHERGRLGAHGHHCGFGYRFVSEERLRFEIYTDNRHRLGLGAGNLFLWNSRSFLGSLQLLLEILQLLISDLEQSLAFIQFLAQRAEFSLQLSDFRCCRISRSGSGARIGAGARSRRGPGSSHRVRRHEPQTRLLIHATLPDLILSQRFFGRGCGSYIAEFGGLRYA